MSLSKSSETIRNIYKNKAESYNSKYKYTNNSIMALLFFIIAIILYNLITAKFIYHNSSDTSFFAFAGIILCILCIFVKNKYYYNYKDSFVCPHCLKNIIPKNIRDIRCPYCNGKNLNFRDLIYGCQHCGDPINIFKCPFCSQDIDLNLPYDSKILKEKRYE